MPASRFNPDTGRYEPATASRPRRGTPTRTARQTAAAKQAAREQVAREPWCAFCGVEEDLTADHIEPLVAGGESSPDNLRTLCRRCNSRRGAGPTRSQARAAETLRAGGYLDTARRVERASS